MSIAPARRRRLPLRLRVLAAPALACAALAGCAKPAPLVTIPAHPPAAVVFENTGVLDVATGTIAAGQDVVVRGGTIAAVGASGTIAVPEGAVRIDGRGGTLLPGLIDSHGHVGNGSAPPWVGAFPDADRNLEAFLYCGVTTVLDPADLEPDAFERRDAVAAGKLVGPTIFASGPMLTAVGGHPIPVLEELAPWWIRWYVKRHAVRPSCAPGHRAAALTPRRAVVPRAAGVPALGRVAARVGHRDRAGGLQHLLELRPQRVTQVARGRAGRTCGQRPNLSASAR